MVYNNTNNEEILVMNDVLSEQQHFLDILSQMKEMHKENKSVQSTLEFIEDCVRNRMERVDAS